MSRCPPTHCPIYHRRCLCRAVFLKSECNSLPHIASNNTMLLFCHMTMLLGGPWKTHWASSLSHILMGSPQPWFLFLHLVLESGQRCWNSTMLCKWKSQMRQQHSRSLVPAMGCKRLTEMLCHHDWAAAVRVALVDESILASANTSSGSNNTAPLFKKDTTIHEHTLLLWFTWVFSLYQLISSQEHLQLAVTWH